MTIKSYYVYVVPNVDAVRGKFYLDYAVDEAGRIINRSEVFDSMEDASARLFAIQAEIERSRRS